MTRRKRTSLQLGEILGASAELLNTSSSQELPVARLRPGLGQPRREFDASKLEELATSIRDKGVLQPLLVRPSGKDFEIVAGERRWRAAQLAGLSDVPVLIRELSDSEARQLALIENLQREDLNLLDEVDAKLALVAETLGVAPEDAKARLMQLLRLPESEEHQALARAFETLGENWTTFARGKLRVLSWPEAVLRELRAGLRFSLGAVIAGAPKQHQQALLDLARQGASRAQLQADLKRLTAASESSPTMPAQVARLLGSQKWLGQLSPNEQKELEAWLGKMPPSLRAALQK